MLFYLNLIVLNIALFTDRCTTFNCIGGIVVSLLFSGAVDHGFMPWAKSKTVALVFVASLLSTQH